jgi:hypothetical protein
MAERFGVPMRSEIYELLLEATISTKERIHIYAHFRQILHMDRLNGMPRYTIECIIRARWRFEKWVMCFVQMIYHVAKYASNYFKFGCEAVRIID